MLNLGGWQIRTEVIEMFPLSIIQEKVFLPLDYSEGVLTIAVADRGSGLSDYVAWLECVLSVRIVCQIADAKAVRLAVEDLYAQESICVTRCQPRIDNPCSRRWLELVETSDPDERHCGDCNRLVHLCFNEQDSNRHAQLGNCVALQLPSDLDTLDSFGPTDVPIDWYGTGLPFSPEQLKIAEQPDPMSTDFSLRLDPDTITGG